MMSERTDAAFLQEFLEVAYGEGPFGSIVLWDKKTKKTRLFDGNSKGELISAIAQDKNDLDLYLGTATQPSDLPSGKRGGNATAQQVSMFFLDVDFAQDKQDQRKYPSDEETASAVLKEFPFPPTFVQRSGGGFHVVWVFERRIACGTPEDIHLAAAISKKFQDMAIAHFNKHGYNIDHCGDLARLFRVPGSLNHKYDPPRRVEVVEWNPDQSIDQDQFSLQLPVDQADTDRNEQIKKHQPADHNLICENCEWYQHQTGKGSAVASEPDWVAALSLTTKCENGPAIAHSYSANYPGYSFRETDRKLTHAEGLGPFKCTTILDEHDGEPFCKDCQFNGLIKSPIQLGDADKVARLKLGALWANESWPDTTKSGKPLKSLPNAKLACERLRITFEYDRFHNRLRIGGYELQVFQGDLTDKAVAKLHSIILDVFGFDPGRGHLLDATHMLCIEHQFHPILDYLDGLVWDGVPRLETWLTAYLGAEDTPLHRAAGKMLLVAAVRRVRQPGVKFDTVVIFEGKQGSGKSTAIYVLSGRENFSDQSLLNMSEKEIMEAIEGVWFFEIAELDGYSRAENSKVKATVTRTEDRGRPAFARFKENWPRQCVFIATTNEDFYLKDQTGNRRFLPVKTNTIDLEALRTDRDQLFAEASILEAQGHSITLPEGLWSAAASAQAERMQEDPWLDILGRVKGGVAGGEERIHSDTLLGEDYLNIAQSQRKPHHLKQVAITMRLLGWEGPKKLRIDGVVARGYSRPTDKPDDPEI